MPPRTIDDVLYIKELDFNFSTDSSNVNPIPIVLDATVEYSKRYSANVTNHPVGDKTDRADNYRVDPPTITFTGIISDSDVGLYSWAFNSVNIEDRGNLNNTGVLNRAQQYIDRLENILENKKLIEIRVPNGLTTTNCLITSLDIKRANTTGEAFEISIAAKQINILTTSIITTPVLDTVVEEKSVGANTTIEPKQDFTLDIIEAENIVEDPSTPINDKLEALQFIRENR